MAVRLDCDTVQELLNEIELDPVVAAVAATPLVVVSEAEYDRLLKVRDELHAQLQAVPVHAEPWAEHEQVLEDASGVVLSWGVDHGLAGKWVYFLRWLAPSGDEKRNKFVRDTREEAARAAAAFIWGKHAPVHQRPIDQMDTLEIGDEMRSLGWACYYNDTQMVYAWVKSGYPALINNQSVATMSEAARRKFDADALMQARAHAQDDAAKQMKEG